MTLDDIVLKKIVKLDRTWTIVDAHDGFRYKLASGTLAWRNNNPGNLKYGEFAKNFGAIGPGWWNHSVFATYADGAEAQRALLFSDEGNYHGLTVRQAIEIYAPADDPNPAAKNVPSEYAKYVADAAGTSANVKLDDLSAEKKDVVLKAMRRFEGYKTGTVTKIGPSHEADSAVA